MHWETALIVAGIFDFTRASLTEVTGVTASANGWDIRVSGIGCSPDGCIPENTLDDSIDPNSRWSCNAASADVDFCELTLEFDAPHDLVQMDMALYKGDMRTRSVNVWVDGVLQQMIESSGTTTDFETYQLIASDAMTVMLQKAGTTDNGWLSVTEIKFMEGDLSPTPSSTAPSTIILPIPTPSPTVEDDDSGLTEVTGVTASANGWDTRVSGVGCAPEGCIPENTLDDSIDPNSRWSCNAVSADVDFCELTLEFDAPRDLVQMDMALYKGDERTRSVNVWVDGVLQQTIESSGTTTDFETYQLIASDAMTVMLQKAGTTDNGWLSVTEIKFMEGDLSPTPSSTAPSTIILPIPTPSPTVEDDDSGLTEVTGVTASANGWDTRVSGVGCAPEGCIPENTLDDSIDPNSRWSCNAASAGVDFCELTLEFDAPRDLVQMDMALYKGDERTRSVNVWVNGVLQETIESSGTTTDFETYHVVASGATSVMLQAVGTNGNGWLSVTEVKFMEGDASPTSLPATMPPSTASPSTILSAPTPSPTVVDDDYAFTPTTSTSPPTAALPPTLQFAGLPNIVFDAVMEDAPYGLANGIAVSDEHGIVLDPEDNGIAHLSGTVRLFDDDQTALAESITLYYYVYSDLIDPVTDFVRGEGEIDPSTGIFSAMVDVPDGKSKVVLTFVVLDEADRTTNLYPDTVVVQDVLNDCGESYFTITLEEWDNEEEYIYLIIDEPNGSGGSPGGFQVNGVILSEPFGVYGAQTYRLFNGLSLDQQDVLGDYRVRVYTDDPLTEEGVNWKVNVRVAGEVVQEETGLFALGVYTSHYYFTYTLESYTSIANC